MKYQAILFDLDGTLLDTLADLTDAMNQALAHFGYPQHDQEAYKTAVGDGIHTFAQRVLPKDKNSPEDARKLVAELQRIYDQIWNHKTSPYQGIPELLDFLAQNNICSAVLSNKPDPKTHTCIKHYFPTHPFSLVMGASDRFPLKPDPAAVTHICQTLQIPKEQWLYLGDTNTDMQTACNAGIKAVGVTWGFRTREELIEHGANIIVDTPLDLIPLLHG